MRFGLCLPNFTPLASPEAIDAAAAAAERLGWDSVWTTDHVLVDTSEDAADYRTNFDVIGTLAWVGARYPTIRLGTSVIVVPQRNAVVLAKELASLDALSGGRVIAGIGVGWSEREFANLAMADRFAVRGAYVEETIGLWRHLWSGSGAPFHGRFHDVSDYVFGPLPAQGAALPIWIGGRAEAALERAGRLADGYHSSASSPESVGRRVPVIRAAAEAAGRPMPILSARVRVAFDEPVHSAEPRPYAMRGSGADVAAEVAKFAELGFGHMALFFEAETLDAFIAAVERFSAEVAPLG
ncbi:MAG TPA: TIGR03619 family F420-dependent LLM class oxidoreductase [Candidatus Deferrimicrobium sp.]|nr:TIGR03619 family F420-dependent LLM class oxidoreductase [Candidatus Deferrimicrobium sp.]